MVVFLLLLSIVFPFLWSYQRYTKSEISCIPNEYWRKGFRLMRILNSVEFVIAFSSKWILSNMPISSAFSTWYGRIGAKGTNKRAAQKNKNMKPKSACEYMLYLSVYPHRSQVIMPGNDETWYNYIAAKHSTKSSCSLSLSLFLSCCDQINIFYQSQPNRTDPVHIVKILRGSIEKQRNNNTL